MSPARAPKRRPARPSLVRRVTHPPLIRSDGLSGEVDTWQLTIGGEPSLAGYQLCAAWELVPGTWTFAVLSGDRVLAQRSFEVVPAPVAATPSDGRCAQAAS